MEDLLASLALCAIGAVYAVGVQRCWRDAGRGRIVPPGRVRCFAAGLGLIAVVTIGPADALVDRSLSAHMVQHVILLAIVAPLLAAGDAVPVLLAAGPGSLRTSWSAHVWSGRTGRRARTSAWPLLIGGTLVLHATTAIAWHLPPAFDAAVAHGGWHLVEHACLVATATLFWWVALVARPRHRRGASVIAIFVLTLIAAAFGAFMTFSASPWYAPYVDAAGAAAAHRDQQLAGVIMWGYGGLIGVAAGVGVFAGWLHASERRDATPTPRLLVHAVAGSRDADGPSSGIS
jgi:cytochrome c oxidase assembly factor CtaG